MGILDSLFKRKKEQPSVADETTIITDVPPEVKFTDWDYQYSQSIYNRNLLGVTFYELELMQTSADPQDTLRVGEYIDMAEGRMMLGVRAKSDDINYLNDGITNLSLSYAKDGESFYIETKLIKASVTEMNPSSSAGPDDIDLPKQGEHEIGDILWEYFIIEIILCAEPVRHHRKHGRVSIEWSVYYRVITDDQVDENDGSGGNAATGKTAPDAIDAATPPDAIDAAAPPDAATPDATTTDAADAAPPDAANATAPATAADATAAATATPATAADTADTADADDIDDGYCVTKTIDISEGGFKSIVETPLAKNTKISCLVEVDNLSRSKGTLIGSVIRCDPMVDSLAMYELTVQFTEMDSSVKEYLVRSIEKKHPGAVDAKAKIVISDDGLEASIELAPPRNNGSDLSFEALNVALASEGVTFGIDSDALRELSEKPLYNLEKTVAHGVAPINGEDAIITYNVDMNPTLMPKEHADGSVDFKDIGLINQVSKDDVLATKIPLTEGTPGRGVTGSIFAPVPGKDKKLPLGANTVVNDLDTDLLAGIDGCISIVDNKINVFDTYVVEGDVQYETGNISHNGIVIIKGDVRYGFAVDATGDIVIHGTVESATVTAGGSLVVKGGCVGEENAIETGGNAAVKFIDGGSFNVRGSLSTTYIINSTIKCGGSIDMIGNGVIRNSHVVAHAEINAKSIGSVRAAADKTVVEVGNDPELLNRFIAATKKLEQLVKDMDSFETTIRALTIRKYKNELSAEKLKVLDKSKILVKQFTLQHDELSEECTMLKDEINKLGYGTIKVQNTAYEGLRIIIGSSTLVLKDSIKAVKFTRNDEGISSAPLY